MTGLFPDLPRDRPRLKRMQVVDAGGEESPAVHLKCPHCGHDAGWKNMDREGWTLTETKRGIPCPICNPKENDDGKPTSPAHV